MVKISGHSPYVYSQAYASSYNLIYSSFISISFIILPLSFSVTRSCETLSPLFLHFIDLQLPRSLLEPLSKFFLSVSISLTLTRAGRFCVSFFSSNDQVLGIQLLKNECCIRLLLTGTLKKNSSQPVMLLLISGRTLLALANFSAARFCSGL